MKPPMNQKVSDVFDAYPADIRQRLLELRSLIYKVAAETDGVGELEETLKWSQPSYLTSQTKSGSTIRIDRMRSGPETVAMYFICHTNLVETFEQMYGDLFTFEDNRALLFNMDDELPVDQLSHCIALALTYHLNKRS